VKFPAKLCHCDGTAIILRCIPSSPSFFSLLLLLDLQPYQTATIDKIARLKDILGRDYEFKSNSEHVGLDIPTPVPPDKVRGYIVSGVLRKLSYVKAITASV
jgi:hypothetical protein